jgi:hypothetical protein
MRLKQFIFCFINFGASASANESAANSAKASLSRKLFLPATHADPERQ